VTGRREDPPWTEPVIDLSPAYAGPNDGPCDRDRAVYATGWTISGLTVLGAIVAVWILGI
jgi:hypothetical protein